MNPKAMPDEDLLQGTREEIAARCSKFLEPRGWRFEKFIHVGKNSVHFKAKTDAFGFYHYLNRDGYAFGSIFTFENILAHIILAKLEILCFEWGADKYDLLQCGGHEESQIYLIDAFLYFKNGITISSKLTHDVLNEKGYQYLRAGFIWDAGQKGLLDGLEMPADPKELCFPKVPKE